MLLNYCLFGLGCGARCIQITEIDLPSFLRKGQHPRVEGVPLLVAVQYRHVIHPVDGSTVQACASVALGSTMFSFWQPTASVPSTVQSAMILNVFFMILLLLVNFGCHLFMGKSGDYLYILFYVLQMENVYG